MKWPLLAMAHHQLRHVREARRWFDQAAERHKRVMARRAEAAAGFALDEDWPEFEIGYAEAAPLLVRGKP